MILDLVFRFAIGVAGISGCYLYFGAKYKWLGKCHKVSGVSAFILCAVTYFMQVLK